MRLVIISCTALLVVSPLGAQDTDRCPADSTMLVPRAAAARDRLGITNHPIQEQNSLLSGARKSVSVNPQVQSRAPGETWTSSVGGYVAGGTMLGLVAAGVGLGIYFSNSDVELIASPIAFAPVFVASAGLGGLVGYFLHSALH